MTSLVATVSIGMPTHSLLRAIMTSSISQKYIKNRNAARGGPRHGGPWATCTEIWEARMCTCGRGYRRTDRQTYRHWSQYSALLSENTLLLPTAQCAQTSAGARNGAVGPLLCPRHFRRVGTVSKILYAISTTGKAELTLRQLNG